MRMSRIIRQIFLQNLNDSQKGRYNRQKIIKIFLKGVRNFLSPVGYFFPKSSRTILRKGSEDVGGGGVQNLTYDRVFRL